MSSTLRPGVPSYRVSYPLDLPGECGATLVHLGSAHAQRATHQSCFKAGMLQAGSLFPGRHYRSLSGLYRRMLVSGRKHTAGLLCDTAVRRRRSTQVCFQSGFQPDSWSPSRFVVSCVTVHRPLHCRCDSCMSPTVMYLSRHEFILFDTRKATALCPEERVQSGRDCPHQLDGSPPCR